ncbi:prepilin-type N-terminal cleavage/methylation domain-containing protein [Synechococcus sp. AH-551-G03]|nr:prepilin-type N-terminal cleavage/methylation domain-containing protein [Synechococcus sp. AH-551-G03]
MKNKKNGFTLIEMMVTLSLLSIVTATTVPMMTKNRWEGDVKSYALKLESGLLDLKAKLGKQKTSCLIEFPEAYSFQKPDNLIEFSQGSSGNTTTMQCCNSEISQLANDPDCSTGAPGYSLSTLTGRDQDNLRIVQYESTPASKAVRVAVSITNFGFTPPGTTLNSDQISFIICHEQSLSEDDPTICIPGSNKLAIRCVQIDGAGEVTNGRWKLEEPSSAISSGSCQTT